MHHQPQGSTISFRASRHHYTILHSFLPMRTLCKISWLLPFGTGRSGDLLLLV